VPDAAALGGLAVAEVPGKGLGLAGRREPVQLDGLARHDGRHEGHDPRLDR